MSEPVLIFVENQTAYFSHEPENAWGDDWDDAPYEHNAGLPYQEIIAATVMFQSSLIQPKDSFRYNSPYSVEQINAKAAPWLHSDRWHQGERVQIWAGTPLSAFVAAIEGCGGEVFLPRVMTWGEIDRGFQREVGEWANATFPESTILSIVKHLGEEADELFEAATEDASVGIFQNDDQIRKESADVYLLLCHLAHRIGFSLHDEARAKFAINKTRTWETDAGGKGYWKHVTEGTG